MTAPKLPTKGELDRWERAIHEEPLAFQVEDRLIAGCREALRFQEERRKLAEAWCRYKTEAVDMREAGAESLLDALAAECGKETE